MRCRFIVLSILAMYAGASQAAIDPIPTENGWGGWVVLGVGYADLESNTVAGHKMVDIGNKSINTVTGSPESDDTFHPALPFELKYTFGDQWQAFLGTNLIDQVTLDSTEQLGIRKQTDSGQRFGLGLLFNGIPWEVWEDPYQTSDVGNRNETDRESAGIRFDWDGILGTGANLTIDFRDIDIDNDRIGQNTTMAPAQPGGICDMACQSQLRRDGDVVRVEAAWLYSLSSRHLIRPSIRFFDDDRDGNAQDSDGYTLQLAWTLLAENYTLVATGAYLDTEFDNPNPIYGIRQDADGFVFSGTMFYNLSKNGRWQAMGSIVWGEQDSDIDFHDNELFQVVVGAYFNFGNMGNRWLGR